MRCTLLHEQCRDGLYPIPMVAPSPHKMCFSTTRPSTLLWHDRLGHPSFKIISRVLCNHELPFVSNTTSEAHVCDACQMAKSHQLSFPHSVSESKAPLELVFFSDVWGPAPSSFGNNNYYVSIDVFLHRQDIGWSRSRVPILRWSCELLRTTKHTIVYPNSDPCYEVIALHPAVCIGKEEQCYKGGELRAQNIR
jgi:hypothetical protein